MTLKVTANRTKLTSKEAEIIYDIKGVKDIEFENYHINGGRKSNNPVINGKKLCSVCRKYKTLDNFGKCSTASSGYFAYCNLCTRWRQRTKSLLNKMEFILEYGGKCQCCGERGIDFLTVEHVEGSKIRNDEGDQDWKFGGSLIANLKYRGWPKEHYSVLCFNCNCCKKFGRPCPHKEEEYQKYMEKVFSYMSGEHLTRYNKLADKLDGVI